MGPGDAKEYLRQLRGMDVAAEQKLRELSERRHRLKGSGSIDYAKERVQTTPEGEASFVLIVAKAVDLEQEINEEIDQLLQRKHQIITEIQRLPDSRYVQLLYKRYVQYKRFEVIAEEMQYSFPHVMRLHEMALKDFARRRKEDTK